MIKSMVFYGNTSIGEVEVWPRGETSLSAAAWAREIRVDRLSPPSERCPPLAVMHTVAVGARCLVMESRPPKTADELPQSLVAMHAACIRENKTAVVPLGEEELHLVAMTSRRNLTDHACFWGYKVPFGLYNSCLTMLNLRCLGIVFDLDETLIVANTTRDQRYQDDKSILKQYIDGDQVYDGKLYKVQPEIRDTSVLVRLRPAWEDLRSYLIARGRKRFEVYVCTMAERDYALEMWRLLDPDSRLINSVQLNDRMVCVKSGLRKSLLNVFHDGSCHPGMALVIDDRLKVWDEKDQSRVHVVPAFTPYYAPQAEANCSIPVLCVARNVAYVGNYLISEDENVAVVNGNRDPLIFDGMADAEVERRMKEASGNVQALNPAAANFVMPVLLGQNFSSSVAPVAPPVVMVPLSSNQGLPASFSLPAAQPSLSDPLQGSPAREEGEVPESELDPDTRRRLLILQHGQDTRDPTPLPVIPPVQASGFSVESEPMHYEKKQPPQPLFHGGENTISSDRFSYQNQRFPSQLPHTEDHHMLQSKYRSFSGEELATRHVPSSQRNNHIVAGQHFVRHAGSSAGILEEIALKCGSKVEYRSALRNNAELQFSIEVWIVGEKVGEGIGRTRKEAQGQAAEVSLRNLANRYLSPDQNKMTDMKENSFGSNPNIFGYPGSTRDDVLPIASTSEESRFVKTGDSIAALKELCTVEGYNLVFHARTSPDGSVGKETYAKVEIGGQILGNGVGITWEEAKLQAADEALETLRSMLGQFAQKRPGSPR
ncbi:hypothetical protein GUJ93_ZPchr0006g44155 [Zizania palustris]|uniref:protein-serine/threonine phosphatase n=1 Tax=Zizania palustris TaxID=103762 RepID=A0A8J5W1U0_ZIZPA|nr:hypothetical protein GUJ93_ZPchr0006g44155 [Zizania palustris]